MKNPKLEILNLRHPQKNEAALAPKDDHNHLVPAKWPTKRPPARNQREPLFVCST